MRVKNSGIKSPRQAPRMILRTKRLPISMRELFHPWKKMCAALYASTSIIYLPKNADRFLRFLIKLKCGANLEINR